MSITQITWIWCCAPTRDASWKAHAHRKRDEEEEDTYSCCCTAQRQSGEGVSVCFTPELANFCDGTFICGIEKDTVESLVCLLGVLCLFSLS